MKRQILGVLLVLSIAFVTLPNAAFASFETIATENFAAIGSYSANTGRSDSDISYPAVGGNLYFNASTGMITDCDSGVTAAFIPSVIGGIAVTGIGAGAFADCKSLKSVTIPDSVTSIGPMAFDNCAELTSVTIPDCVTAIGHHTFADCTSLTNIILPDRITSIDDFAFLGCLSLTDVKIGNGVTVIGSYAFSHCSSLNCLTIGNQVTGIGYHAFAYCESLKSVIIPDCVAVIGDGAFVGCTGLTSVAIGNSVTMIGKSAFEDCVSLLSVTIPDSVTEIGDSAFRRCTSLTNVTLGNSLKTIAPLVFSDCSSLMSVTIPDSVTTIEREAFHYCTSLTSVTLGTCLESIGEWAFGGCTSLKTLIFSDGLKTIDYMAFVGCTSLTSVAIGKGVETIESLAFYECSGLLTVIIPETVTRIVDGAFNECANLKNVYFCGDAPEIGAIFRIWDSDIRESIRNPGLTLYYIEGKDGWTTPTWGEEEYPTAIWDGVNIPHEYNYIADVTAPTCTEEGYTTHTCPICGDSFVDSRVDALGHDYVGGICTRCGEEEQNDFAPTVTFTDVSPNAWYADSVNYIVENGLMNGMGKNEFRPEEAMTRAMLVTVLWRYAGSPVEGTNGFNDLTQDWYIQAVAWASKNGIVNGYPDGTFKPDDKVTREQLATIIYRYCNTIGINTSARADFGAFPDAKNVNGYASDAISWAVSVGLITGITHGGNATKYLEPQTGATRAQVATILMRFIENVAKQ